MIRYLVSPGAQSSEQDHIMSVVRDFGRQGIMEGRAGPIPNFYNAIELFEETLPPGADGMFEIFQRSDTRHLEFSLVRTARDREAPWRQGQTRLRYQTIGNTLHISVMIEVVAIFENGLDNVLVTLLHEYHVHALNFMKLVANYRGTEDEFVPVLAQYEDTTTAVTEHTAHGQRECKTFAAHVSFLERKLLDQARRRSMLASSLGGFRQAGERLPDSVAREEALKFGFHADDDTLDYLSPYRRLAEDLRIVAERDITSHRDRFSVNN